MASWCSLRISARETVSSLMLGAVAVSKGFIIECLGASLRACDASDSGNSVGEVRANGGECTREFPDNSILGQDAKKDCRQRC